MISLFCLFLISHFQTLAVFDRFYQIKPPKFNLNPFDKLQLHYSLTDILSSLHIPFVFWNFLQYCSSRRPCPYMPTCAKLLLWFNINFILSILMSLSISCASYPNKMLFSDMLVYIKHHLICLFFWYLRIVVSGYVLLSVSTSLQLSWLLCLCGTSTARAYLDI